MGATQIVAMRAELRGVLTGFAFMAAGAVVLARVDLGVPGQSLLQSLQLHLGLAIAGLAVLLALSGAYWRAALVLGLAIFAVGHVALRVSTQQQGREPFAAAQRVGQFSLLSFNALYSNTDGARVMRQVVDSGADIAVILEAVPLRPYLDELAETYPYQAGCDEDCDMAIFSRVPLENVEIRSLGIIYSDRLILAQVRFDGLPVTIAAAHLTKPYFDNAGVYEARQLGRVLGRVEGPLVLAGDFNAAPWSDAINDLLDGAQLLPPPRYHATWPTEFGSLGLPIDNIFSRGPAIIDRMEVLPDPIGSNHLGLIAQVGMVGE